MHVDEGQVVSWSPLIGLECQDTFNVREHEFSLVPVGPAQLNAIEEKDIARDFISSFHFDPDLQKKNTACIALPDTGDHDLPKLLKRRTTATIILRLAGFNAFLDPELLGWYIYEGSRRFRMPTVFRQSVLKQFANPATEHITQESKSALSESSTLFGRYLKRESPDVNRLLGEFLRAHPRPFILPNGSALLLLAT
jgi:hypothetical protein